MSRIDHSGDIALGQCFTPEWAAQALVDRFFSDLPQDALVIEPSCGPGAFLKAFPASMDVVGFELDRDLARLAKENTDRLVYRQDFLAPFPGFALDGRVDLVIGNTPFILRLFEKFLERIHPLLKEEGRAAFIIPSSFLQTSSTVLRLAGKWSMERHALPRDLFFELSKPIEFCIFRKDGKGELNGFALHREQADIRKLFRHCREILVKGQPKLGVWDALVTNALLEFDGEASLQFLYAAIGPAAPDTNSYPREKIRATLYRGENTRYLRTRTGWMLNPTPPTTHDSRRQATAH